MVDDTVDNGQRQEAQGTSAAVEMRTVPAESVVRMREGQRPRRNPRIDGLGDLHPTAAPPPAEGPVVTMNIRKIALCLFRLDLWTLDTLQMAYYGSKPQINSGYEYEDFKQLLGDELARFVEPEIYDFLFEATAKTYLDQLSESRLIACLLDERTYMYYEKLVRLRISLHRIAESKQRYAEKTPVLAIPETENWLKSPEEYLGYLVDEGVSTRHKLKTVVNEVRTLCGCIKDAAEGGELDGGSLEILKFKVVALHDQFIEACKELDEAPRALIASGRSQWWSPETEADQLSQIDQAPKRAVQAYRGGSNTSATLSFIVPTISLVSCIPAALAWYNSPPQRGTWHDANFYQQLSSSFMQVLGLLTLIGPRKGHKRPANLAWFWTWVLAGTSACFTVLAVPLYLLLPTGWSALLSFSGSVAQVLVLLQLVLTI